MHLLVTQNDGPPPVGHLQIPPFDTTALRDLTGTPVTAVTIEWSQMPFYHAARPEMVDWINLEVMPICAPGVRVDWK